MWPNMGAKFGSDILIPWYRSRVHKIAKNYVSNFFWKIEILKFAAKRGNFVGSIQRYQVCDLKSYQTQLSSWFYLERFSRYSTFSEKKPPSLTCCCVEASDRTRMPFGETSLQIVDYHPWEFGGNRQARCWETRVTRARDKSTLA